MSLSLKRGLFFFSFFIIFSIFVKLGIFDSLDKIVTITLQNWLTDSFDTLLSLFSLLGSFELTMIILTAALFKLGLKKSFVVVTIFLLGIVLELLGKLFLHHPGPPSLFFRYNLDFYFPSGAVQTGYSYPSGHSYRTAFLTILLAHLLKKSKIFSVILFSVLVIMLISRISLGEHWTTDVLGGVLLGFSLAFFSIHLLQTRFLRPNQVK